ncbi:hypothetical protein [Actinoplanes subtropicus]|uniref:hypothetical protein n=1 Tax=Actinoplanes subtropicus TaxID=543632 RepID=UPI000AA7BD61|nr:hypothetical protein [Actinoplanes subtropicus]
MTATAWLTPAEAALNTERFIQVRGAIRTIACEYMLTDCRWGVYQLIGKLA